VLLEVSLLMGFLLIISDEGDHISMIFLLSPIVIVYSTRHYLPIDFIPINELLLLRYGPFDRVRRETI